LKPSEAFLRLPPLLPCGDLALLAPIVVYRQYPGASAQICKLQVYHARQAHQGLMSQYGCDATHYAQSTASRAYTADEPETEKLLCSLDAHYLLTVLSRAT
jgi:hypothetical protein